MINIVQNIISKIKQSNIEEYDEDEKLFEDLYDRDIEEKDQKYNFPISASQAIEIANKNENLKTDFYRRYKGNISYLYFSKKKVDIVELEGKQYWQIQILDGKISGIEKTKNGTKFWDGIFLEKDLRKLRCLINVKTGEYLYYPNTKKIPYKYL